MVAEPARHTIAIAVLDGTLALDVAVALQAFGPRPTAFLAMRHELQSPYDVFLCGGSEARLRTIGMAVRDLEPWSRLASADTVIVPGLDEPDRRRDPEALSAVAAAAARGARIVGLCAGAFVLGFAGVLDGRRVTTHWALADQFRRLFPRTHLLDDELFIDDGDVLTAGGGAAGMDLGLHLVRVLRGAEVANRLARSMVVPPHRAGGQAQYIESPVPEPDLADPVGETMSWALARLDQLLPVDTLARRANMSRRNFDRRFRELTGAAPANWLTHQRVIRAQRLLESTALPVDVVARRCGFSSGAALRPHFRRLVGVVPVAYRETFGLKPS